MPHQKCADPVPKTGKVCAAPDPGENITDQNNSFPPSSLADKYRGRQPYRL